MRRTATERLSRRGGGAIAPGGYRSSARRESERRGRPRSDPGRGARDGRAGEQFTFCGNGGDPPPRHGRRRACPLRREGGQALSLATTTVPPPFTGAGSSPAMTWGLDRRPRAKMRTAGAGAVRADPAATACSRPGWHGWRERTDRRLADEEAQDAADACRRALLRPVERAGPVPLPLGREFGLAAADSLSNWENCRDTRCIAWRARRRNGSPTGWAKREVAERRSRG